ncbi:MAG: hypothetical protein IKY41_08845 [Clostridia bacterium]|nr:hypothetical protein [Clostridia bacterium]
MTCRPVSRIGHSPHELPAISHDQMCGSNLLLLSLSSRNRQIIPLLPTVGKPFFVVYVIYFLNFL